MRHLSKHNLAQMGMVGTAVGLFITLIIAILVYYNVAGSIDTVTVDTALGGTYNATSGAWTGPSPATNATTATNNQAATFFTIAPIIGIVIVAVVVIGYVQRIGG